MIDGSEQIIEKAVLKASQIKDAALEFCITGDTLVLTKNGYARIGTIKVGDYVYSRDLEGKEEGTKKYYKFTEEILVNLYI
ncbi:Hint domain-containing protein [Clostridium guangxiense]|uniref:hypothetical protein n=1 Tax=Clostridium guangxiense TaxID=1662055 RepID=UPI001E4C37BE|nr:hypothetical protein [Clostridium guangxiense]MCD2346291.1 hypothetical protein [Clostridium guangxiense]